MLRLKVCAAMAVLAVLASGCQLQLGMDVAVARDGSGVVELAVGLDEELLSLLTEAGFDPTVGLENVIGAESEWDFEDLDVDQGLAYAFRAEFDDPDHFARLVGDFGRGLGPGDPQLFDDLEIVVEDDGSVVFRGDAGLVLPSTTGIEGADVSFDAEDLEALLTERGDEFVRYELRVTLPAEPVAHDGDARDGDSVTWQLPVGDLRTIEARSAPVADRTLLFASAAGLVGLVVGAVVAVWLRRRRLRREE